MDKQKEITASSNELYKKLSWLNGLKMQTTLSGNLPSEIHAIEFIANHTDPNVTQIADYFYMTRGAVSKLTRKMMQKGYIERYQKADNRKERYFKLTDSGRKINEIHSRMHAEFDKRDVDVFNALTDEQAKTIIDFMNNYSHHLDAEIKVMEEAKDYMTD